MNRHDRRRQAKTAGLGKFVITGEFFEYDDLIELLDQSPTIAPILGSMHAAMGGDRPPLRGGCGVGLIAVVPPACYLLLQHSDSAERLLTGICFECIARDPEALRRRFARALGLQPLPAAHLQFGSWERA